MEQLISIPELKKLLPKGSQVEVRRFKETQRIVLSMEVKLPEAMSEQDHRELLDKIMALYGEDLIQIHGNPEKFTILLRMSSIYPTTVIF